MRKLCGYFGAGLVVVIFIAGFIAYFVRGVSTGGVELDGFGRELVKSPWFMRLIFGQEKLWAGWFWWIGDMVIFFGGIALGASLANFGFSDKKK